MVWSRGDRVRSTSQPLSGPSCGGADSLATRVVDVGCGAGQLTGYLQSTFPSAEIFGFDLTDFYVEADTDFPRGAIERLTKEIPGVDWADRVRSIGLSDAWPFEDASLDVGVSDHVLEHVQDIERFFTELRRCLRPGGFSLHVFPLRHTVVDFDVFRPFVHTLSRSNREAAMRLFARIGVGTYRRFRDRLTIREYAALAADYLENATAYRSLGEIRDAAAAAGLRAVPAYSHGLYVQKIRRVLGRRPGARYRARAGPLLYALAPLASVTVLVERVSSQSETA